MIRARALQLVGRICELVMIGPALKSFRWGLWRRLGLCYFPLRRRLRRTRGLPTSYKLVLLWLRQRSWQMLSALSNHPIKQHSLPPPNQGEMTVATAGHNRHLYRVCDRDVCSGCDSVFPRHQGSVAKSSEPFLHTFRGLCYYLRHFEEFFPR